MKNVFLILVLIFAFIWNAPAQTGVSSWNVSDQNGTCVVTMILSAQTTDSTTAITSKQFSLPSYNGVDLYTYPATFLVKTVSTYTGTPPKCLITLNGVYGGTHSVVLDSLRNNTTNQSVTDTTGVLTLNGKRAPAYTITLTNSGNKLAAGAIIQLVFVKPRTYEIK